MAFEYKVVPAPVKGVEARGVKSGPDRFAHALETVMNDLAADGWEYQRTDTLPSEEREGLMGKTTVFQNMLVFRRAVNVAVAEEPKSLPAPVPVPVAPQEPHVLENAVEEAATDAPAPDVADPAPNDADAKRVAAE